MKLGSRLILTLYIGDRNDPDNLLFNTSTMGHVLAFLSVIYTLHFHHSLISQSSLNHHSLALLTPIIHETLNNEHSII